MREAVDAAEGMKRVRAQAAEIAQRVVAVARALAAEERPRFPSRVGLPEQLRLAETRRPRIDVFAGDVVHGEAVAARVAKSERGRELVADERSRRRGAYVAAREIAERRDGAAAPFLERRLAAHDVDDAAECVPAEQGALRSAHELHLVDVEELDARGV